MADYTQPDAVEKRTRFFDGQFLQDQDFVDEQKYHLDRERRLSRALRITGITEGLAVSSPAANKVTVTKGTAIDTTGRQMVLAADRTFDLPASFRGKQAVNLYVFYQEDLSPDPEDMPATGSQSPRRWLERPKIVAATADTPPIIAASPDSTFVPAWETRSAVLLAQLNLSSSGVITVLGVMAQNAGISVKGNVGIGAASPVEKLHISGGKLQLDGNQQIKFADGDTSNNLKLQLWSGYGLGINASTLFYASAGNHSWRDESGTNERMLLTTAAEGGLTVKGTGNSSFAGNLGIGTTSPGAKLAVNSDSATVNIETAEVMRLMRPGVSGVKNSNSAGLRLGAFEQGVSGRARLDISLSGAPGSANGYGTVPDVMVMSLLANGNVGIGTTSPRGPLEVIGTQTAGTGTITSSGTTVTGSGTAVFQSQLQIGDRITVSGQTRTVNTITSNTVLTVDSAFAPAITAASAFTFARSALLIAASGNLGIGTASPENADGWNKVVDVLGSGHAKLSVRTASIDARVLAHDTGFFGSPAGMIVGTKSNHPLSFGTNAATRMTISAAGNVGIDTPTAESKLTVNANIAHDNTYANYGDAPLTVFEPTANGGSSPNGTRDILNLVREGVSAQAFGNKVSLAIGRYENSALNSRTQLDIKLTDNSFNTHTAVMSLRSNGNVGIGTTSPGARLEVKGGLTILEQEAWKTIPLSNGWGSYGAEYGPGEYFKNSHGVVHLRGLIKVTNVAAWAAFVAVGNGHYFQLPSGYRPKYRQIFTTLAGSSNGLCRVDISDDGKLWGMSGDPGTWLSLDSISFRAE